MFFENKSQIIQEIIEFYRIQPRVKDIQLEKIEEYLILMNAFFIGAIGDIEKLCESKQTDIYADAVSILNSYINSIDTENRKIFPDEDNGLLSTGLDLNVPENELKMFEMLKNFNERDAEDLSSLEERAYNDEFLSELIEVIRDLIVKINSEAIVKVDDLL